MFPFQQVHWFALAMGTSTGILISSTLLFHQSVRRRFDFGFLWLVIMSAFLATLTYEWSKYWYIPDWQTFAVSATLTCSIIVWPFLNKDISLLEKHLQTILEISLLIALIASIIVLGRNLL
jgi:hypothetical protein